MDQNNPFGQNPGYRSHTAGYTPPDMYTQGMAWVMQWLTGIPQNQFGAPIGMYQYDYNTLLANARERANVSWKSQTFNPLAIFTASRAMQMAGIQDPMSYMYNRETGQPTMLGMGTSFLMGSLVGGTDYAYRNNIFDLMKGFSIDPQGYRRSGMGVSTGQADRILRDLTNNVYADNLHVLRRGQYSMGDMMETFSMGRNYDMFLGSNERGVSVRTANLAGLLQSGGNVFNTTNKEETISKILELTGGSTSLQNTSQLQNALQKTNDIARSASISIDLMQQIVARGAEVAKQIGVSGMAGTFTAINAANSFAVTRNGISPDAIMQSGGQLGSIQAIADANTLYLGSSQGKQLAGLYGAYSMSGMNMLGIENNIRKQNLNVGSFNAMREGLVEHLTKNLYGGDRVAGEQAAEAYISRYTSKGQMMLAQNFGQDIQAATSTEVMRTLAATSRYSDAAGNNYFLQSYEDLEFLRKGSPGGKLSDERYRAAEAIFIERAKALNPGQKPVVYEQMFRSMTDPNYTRDYEALQKTSARSRVGQNYLESVRRFDTAWEKGFSAVLGGESMSSVLKAAILNPYDPYGKRGTTKQFFKDFYSPGGQTVFEAASSLFGVQVGNRQEAAELLRLTEKDFQEKLDPAYAKLISGANALDIPSAIKALQASRPGMRLTVAARMSMQYFKGANPDVYEQALDRMRTVSSLGLDINKELQEIPTLSQEEVKKYKEENLQGPAKIFLDKLKDTSIGGDWENSEYLKFALMNPEERNIFYKEKAKMGADVVKEIERYQSSDKEVLQEQYLAKLAFSQEEKLPEADTKQTDVFLKQLKDIDDPTYKNNLIAEMRVFGERYVAADWLGVTNDKDLASAVAALRKYTGGKPKRFGQREFDKGKEKISEKDLEKVRESGKFSDFYTATQALQDDKLSAAQKEVARETIFKEVSSRGLKFDAQGNLGKRTESENILTAWMDKLETILKGIVFKTTLE